MGRTAEQMIEQLSLDTKLPADKATDKLQSVCRSLAERLFGGRKSGSVVLEPGFTTNMGLEQKVVVEVSARSFRDVLFRAYVPVDGYPVEVDFYGENPVRCTSESDLDKAVGQFIKRPEVLARLKQYMSLGQL
jgi:hypothetical protein